MWAGVILIVGLIAVWLAGFEMGRWQASVTKYEVSPESVMMRAHPDVRHGRLRARRRSTDRGVVEGVE